MQNTHAQYAKLVRLAAFSAFFGAILMIVIKLFAWFVTDASAMLASASDSILDLFASSINLVILRFALAPPDEEHKFGHGKAESLAGLLQSAFVMGSAGILLLAGIDRVLSPVVISQVSVGVWVTITSLAITFVVVAIQSMVIKKTKSVAISADALHYKSDVILNLGVLLSLGLTQYLAPEVDGIFTCLVGIYLFWGGFKIVSTSVKGLMDEEISPEDKDKIVGIIKSHPQVYGFHDLRTRTSGPVSFIQFHLEVSGELPLKVAHGVGDEVEALLKVQFPNADVIIHLDPN